MKSTKRPGGDGCAGAPKSCGTPEGGSRLIYRDGRGAGTFSLLPSTLKIPGFIYGWQVNDLHGLTAFGAEHRVDLVDFPA